MLLEQQTIKNSNNKMKTYKLYLGILWCYNIEFYIAALKIFLNHQLW